MNFLQLLPIFLKASMLSSGGLQMLPILREDLLFGAPILTDADFAKAVSIGRITPGPNGLFVLSVGYYTGGIPGALAALIGVSLPPFIGILLVRAHRRLAGKRWVVGATRGVTATAVGLLSAVGYSFTEPLLTSVGSMLIILATIVILVRFKIDALPLLIGGGIVGALCYAAGVYLA